MSFKETIHEIGVCTVYTPSLNAYLMDEVQPYKYFLYLGFLRPIWPAKHPLLACTQDVFEATLVLGTLGKVQFLKIR